MVIFQVLKMHLIYYFFIIFFLILFVKAWKKSFASPLQKFENPALWSARRLPCPNDIVFLPDDFFIYLSQPLSGSQIELPNNGLIVIENMFYLNNESAPYCVSNKTVSKENRLKMKKDFWLNSNAWDVKISHDWFQGSDHELNPIPDVLRVPCKSDDIQFAKESSIKLNLDIEPMDAFVRSVEIHGNPVMLSEFKAFVYTDIGKMMFDFNGKTLFRSLERRSNQGFDLTCNRNLFALQEQICAFSKPVCPKKLACQNPIRPVGFCCDFCGSMLNVQFSNYQKINYEMIENLVANLQYEEHEDSLYYINLLDQSHFEITIVNKKLELSKSFAHEIQMHLESANLFKLSKFRLHFSGVKEQTAKKSNSFWTMVFICFLCICSYSCYKKREQIVFYINRLQATNNIWRNNRINSFTFIRFNSENEDQLELQTNIHSLDDFRQSVSLPQVD